MAKIKVVIWDNIGNTMLGMRHWDEWDTATQERLLIEDPQAREHVVSIPELFKDDDVEIVWLYNYEKSRLGFSSLIDSHDQINRAIKSVDDITDAIEGADFLILHKEILPPEALAKADSLRLIQHLGRDYRGVPMAEAKSREIPVAATALVNYSAVAEHVWAQIMSMVKRLPDQRQYMISRDYVNGWGAYHPGVTLLSDLTLGLVGLGEIARPIARVAQAFNMRLLYWDIVRFPELEERYGIEYVEWDEIYAQSDILSIQLALNAKTEGIVGAREIGLMKPTSLFINTARGRLVDQVALEAALVNHQIGGAALDVYYDEPVPTDSVLHQLHESADYNVMLTPHSAAQGPWTWVHDSQDLWFNIRRMLDGEPIRYLVTE